MSTQNKPNKPRGSYKRLIWEMCVFAMFGAIMFCSKIIMEVFPNIHLLGALTMVYTLVFRSKALIPIYIYVFLNGLFAGFPLWWVPYLYIWTILWGVTMLLPRRMPKWLCVILYPVICALHGLAFGILYAPAQALFFNLNFEQMIAWMASGAVFDIVHCIGNFLAGLLVFPLSELLKKLSNKHI